MISDNFDPKTILASALISTSLFAASPAMRESIDMVENIAPTTREQTSARLEKQLCNYMFQCNKTGLIVQFLPNFKTLFLHPDTNKILKGEYQVQFNRDITMSVYENPSKRFDFMLHNISLQTKGFSANINQKERYFQKV